MSLFFSFLNKVICHFIYKGRTDLPVQERLWRAVAAPQPGALGEDELELRGGPARDEGPDQCQRVLVKVGCGHEGVQHRHGKRGPAGERLGEVQLRVGVVVVIL